MEPDVQEKIQYKVRGEYPAQNRPYEMILQVKREGRSQGIFMTHTGFSHCPNYKSERRALEVANAAANAGFVNVRILEVRTIQTLRRVN